MTCVTAFMVADFPTLVPLGWGAAISSYIYRLELKKKSCDVAMSDDCLS